MDGSRPRRCAAETSAGRGNRLILPLFLACGIWCMGLMPDTSAQTVRTDDFQPPYRVRIDTVLNAASWRAPGLVFLSEDFEMQTFPPPGWNASSGGKGWMRSYSGPFLTWTVPEPGSWYALVNDDSASVGNDGSLDFLVLPPLDLTLADSCKLIFSFFFNAAYGQAAAVEYRTGPYGLWTEVRVPEAVFDWTMDTIDLSPFSGSGGSEWFQLAFHADDRGHHASGWAIDDIEVFGRSVTMNPVDYLLFWDGEKLDSTTALSFSLPFSYYGEDHQFGICARYENGNSDTVLIDFESRNLPPPENLEIAYTFFDNIVLDWSWPEHPPFCTPWDLQFVFPTEAGGIQGGCESDGQYIYISYQYAPKFDQYDLAGNFIETFTIGGIPGILDMAWDPGYGFMYGSHGGNTVYVMDFQTRTLVDQFTAPCTIRGLAYDPQDEVFYANNLSSRITVFELFGGDTLFTFPVGQYGNYYGLAMDWDEGYLWGFSRDSTGALLVQYDVSQRQTTGLLLDVSSLAENGGQACGLYVQYDLTENCVTLGGNLWNDVAFGYALRENFGYGWSPPGVDHYIVYNQDTVIGESDWSQFSFEQPEMEEHTYKFEVSAWYDLTEFGYPGQFKESEKDGPVIMNGIPPDPNQEIEFLENWESGSFYFHQWDTAGNAWQLHPNHGNPPPSAVFRGMVNYGQYEGWMTSDWFIVDKEDSCEVLLEYDLKIFDVIPTGRQTMQLEAFDIAGNTWQVIKTYHNDTLMTSYITDSILLTPYVTDHTMRFRFHIFGVDATDVGYWIIDNIRVDYTCLPPFAMTATMLPGQDSVKLSWQHRYDADLLWLHYDDSVAFAAAGTGNGPDQWFDVAAYWDMADIRLYNQYFITGLAFIPAMEEASYVPGIWTGQEGEQLVYRDIAAGTVPGEWYLVDVEPPVPLDTLTNLWIGYSCSSRGGLPFSMDAGPAADGYGNLIRMDGAWTTMLAIDPALDCNFNIQVRLEKPAKKFEAFQVFRSIAGLPFQHVATTDSLQIILPLSGTAEEECFRSRQICFNRPGFIRVSGFSGIDCVTPVSINDAEETGSPVSVFPNPSSGMLNVESTAGIERIEIYNSLGHCVLSERVGQSSACLDLSDMQRGIYLLRIDANGWSEARKLLLVP